MKLTVLMLVIFLLLVLLDNSVDCQRPSVVKIGAVFTFNSVIGRAAKAAMELAVSDINADPRILNGTQLKLIKEDAECNVFLGSMRAFQVLDNEVVAIIGPESSPIAHMISQIANGLHVPLVSYAATDPTLSALQFPYFLRSTHSDFYQMEAVADFINFYGWKEVIAIFIDNDYGRNGISVLGDELTEKMAKISYKLALPSQFDVNFITDVLNNSKYLGPRVYVVHINPDPMLRFFHIAQQLNMMTSEYVWLATDWLSSTLDSLSKDNQDLFSILEGVIVFRPHTPTTTLKKAFVSRWRKLQQRDTVHSGLNVYGLYAYDTVWAVAHAIDKILKQHINISFSSSGTLQDAKTNRMQLGKFKVFNGGELLLKILSETNLTGLTGQIRFNADRNIIITGYEVVNIVRMVTRVVSYWSNHTGFSLLPPEFRKENQTSYSHPDQKIDNVTWPGGMTKKPRGWVIANGGRPLRIGIPKRASFTEFVTELDKSHNVQGYCINLFDEARQLVPYDVPSTFVPFGNGLSNPNYDALVKMVADGVFDAAIGDIAIVTNRTRNADFTQPFAATGLVIVVPIDNSKSTPWVFVKPFALKLWAVIAISFVVIAVVIWILEHRVNDEFRGPPKQQLRTMFLFSFSTLFKTNQEKTISPLSRMVMVVWLFLLMVVTSSYTASLTSILTVQQLSSSTITGIDSLIASDWPIGYQVGSFAYSYLKDNLNIRKSRLVSLGSPEEYEKALRQGPKSGGVAAIVDELPYIELFLSNRTDFIIVGQPFTKGGWGFAFQKDSPLAVDMSTAILKLAESGKLQEIHHKWFCKPECPAQRIHNPDPNQLHLRSFLELFILCGVFSLGALLLFLFRVARQYARYQKKQMETPTSSTTLSSNVHCSKVLHNFFDFIDEKEEAIKRYFNQHNNSQSQVS
ncbi:unnamed protein product [Coffea canephora]|uniref:Glutamate receptor n=3 Tax=Coffea TaxID=13442 RepID=A0A068UU69_COFCA|nr:glutamate receptor 3.7-like [Coffea arabica]CDP11784.1 unnamed protein product [Coffea canephora]